MQNEPNKIKSMPVKLQYTKHDKVAPPIGINFGHKCGWLPADRECHTGQGNHHRPEQNYIVPTAHYDDQNIIGLFTPDALQTHGAPMEGELLYDSMFRIITTDNTPLNKTSLTGELLVDGFMLQHILPACNKASLPPIQKELYKANILCKQVTLGHSDKVTLVETRLRDTLQKIAQTGKTLDPQECKKIYNEMLLEENNNKGTVFRLPNLQEVVTNCLTPQNIVKKDQNKQNTTQPNFKKNQNKQI